MQRVNYTKKHRFISLLWNSSLPGKGTLSRSLSKFLIPAPKEPVISKTLYGFDLVIDASIDNGVENSLYFFGTYERGTLDFIKKHLKTGDVFFDIGANIGLMSIFASYCVGPEGKVLSFEANPETAKLLQYNIELNSLRNIQVINKAVGNSTGQVKIYSNWKINRGGASIVNRIDNSESFDVELIRPSDMKEYLDLPVNMIKIDVEGFEMDVLKGIEAFLKRNSAPILIIEYSSDRNNNYNALELYQLVLSHSYTVYKLSRGKERNGELIEVKTKADLPEHDNIFCFRK